MAAKTKISKTKLPKTGAAKASPFALFKKKDRKLGVSHGRRRYDLPLNSGSGADFLILLIALMTFLGVMALAGSFALSSLAYQWSSGLENKMTIEIPATDENNAIRDFAAIEKLALQIEARLKPQSRISAVEVLSEKDIKALISPWLGDTTALSEMPLPGLISVELTDMSDAFIQELDAELKTLVPNVVLDTHESWLADILKLTNALQAATWLITIMIGITTVTAIAGAVKSRIAIHKSDVELLHLMGASDTYISRQFQRHTWILSFQGAMAGMLTGALTLALIGYFAGDTGAALLPEFQIQHYHLGTLAALPALACIIAAMTARITVLRALAKMP